MDNYMVEAGNQGPLSFTESTLKQVGRYENRPTKLVHGHWQDLERDC